MPTVQLHVNPSLTCNATTGTAQTSSPLQAEVPNPLPSLLHTPHGLAIIEMQGTLNLPIQAASSTYSLPNTPLKPTLKPRPLPRAKGDLDAMDMDMDMDIPSSSAPSLPPSSPLPQASAAHRSRYQDEPGVSDRVCGTAHEADIPIGRLVFSAEAAHTDANAQLSPAAKKVYFYVGRRQRLVGEMKALSKPLAVIRRREEQDVLRGDGDEAEELELVDIVRYKLYFGGRPEFV